MEIQDAEGWYPAKSTKGHFFIKSPIPFNDYTITTIDENIGALVIHGIGSKSTDGYEFGTIETVLTEKMKRPEPQMLVDETAKKMKASSPQVSIEDRDNERVSFAELHGSTRTVMMRLSSTSRSFFTVMCDFPKEQNQTGKDICTEYLGSFRID
ncbi:hypothetical protein [Rhizobium skierniewicense]|uniref:hypothetical protein n=1 Tax=Rhizobium skierniewicense TaxID=984260 RepID=UPI001572A1AA|nr:hypothetical protein [Rhizobium skierniewicense]NTF32903.1 hypothetical protein [Rhizobium skierniewicense]